MLLYIRLLDYFAYLLIHWLRMSIDTKLREKIYSNIDLPFDLRFIFETLIQDSESNLPSRLRFNTQN